MSISIRILCIKISVGVQLLLLLTNYYASIHVWLISLSALWVFYKNSAGTLNPERLSGCIMWEGIHHQELMSMLIRGHIRLLWALLQRVNDTQLWFLLCNQLQNRKSQRCLKCVPKRGQFSAHQTSIILSCNTTNLNHHKTKLINITQRICKTDTFQCSGYQKKTI